MNYPNNNCLRYLKNMDSELLKQLMNDDVVKGEILKQLKFKEWMDIHETCEYLSISIRSLYRLIKDEKIPYKYIPGTKRIRFRKRHLDLWIETGRNVVTDSIPTKIIREINKLDSS